MAGKAKISSCPFTMFRRSIWHSKRFASLPNDAARYLYIYFLTHPQQTSTGCFRLTAPHALADLAAMTGADWTAANYEAGRAAIIKNELILADDETHELLITRWWQDNGPTNEDWFNGVRKYCEAIKSPSLRAAAQDALGVCWQAFLTSKLPSIPRGASEPTPFPTAADRLNALGNKR